MTDQELDDYIANAKRKSEETGLPIIRQDSVLAPAYKPKKEESALPAIGGVLGGVAGGLLIKNPMAGQAAGRAFVGSLLPSLAGSTAGTVAGTVAERGMAGDLFSSEGAKQLLGNAVENAAWDVGGNLAFSFAGKTYRLGKEALSKLGITKQGGMFGTELEATKAAQEFLSNRGATLTAGQLESSPGLQAAESFLKGGTGAGEFAQQQKNVQKAIKTGADEVISKLEVSPSFAKAMQDEEPLKLAAGENFQNLINIARGEFKDTYRPFYQKLSQDTGVFVDMRPIKQKAKEELLRIEKIKGAGASAERKSVINDILKQDDMLDFAAAHDLQSGFGGAANDLAMPGKNATSKEAAYREYGKMVSDNMRSALVDSQAGKDLIREYDTVSSAYKAGMDGLYNGTIVSAMKSSPSKVGSYLADLTEPEKFKDLYKAVAEIDKYAAKKASSGALNDLKYTFLSDSLGTPERAKSFVEYLKKDEDLNKAFYRMFRNEAPELKKLLNAADIGLSSQSGVRYYLDNRLAGHGYQATAGIVGYLALPSDVQDKLKDNLPEAALYTGSLLLTPKLLAKAATNREAMNALIGLSKYKEGTKIGGALAAKMASQLTKAGIIDSEYISSVNNFFNAPQENQPTEPIVPAQTELTPELLDEYINSKKE